MFRRSLLIALLALTAAPSFAWAAPEGAELVKLVEQVDERQRTQGDWKSIVYIENKEAQKADVVYEAQVYRRQEGSRLMILFDKPKTSQGQGYLRLEKNLWFYDPSVGKWERRTERERIGGTNSRREDFDQSRLAEEYDPTYVGEEKLGRFQVHHLKLSVKKGVDVGYPVVELWIDTATGNVLKRQEFALSGKLMRTSLQPKWEKVFSESKKSDVWYAKEIHIYDEVEKANQTLIVIKSVDLKSLDANLFTKAWLESKSR